MKPDVHKGQESGMERLSGTQVAPLCGLASFFLPWSSLRREDDHSQLSSSHFLEFRPVPFSGESSDWLGRVSWSALLQSFAARSAVTWHRPGCSGFRSRLRGWEGTLIPQKVLLSPAHFLPSLLLQDLSLSACAYYTSFATSFKFQSHFSVCCLNWLCMPS